MFINILNSPNYISSKLKAETEGVGVGRAGRMWSWRQGTLLMLPLSIGCIIFLGREGKNAFGTGFSYLRYRGDIHASNSFHGFICQLT